MRRDVEARKEMCRGVQHRGEQHRGARAGLTLDGRVHRPAQEGLLDERDRETAQRARHHQFRQRGGGARRVGAPFEQAERRHDADHGEHGQDSEREREAHLPHERAPGQPVSEARAVAEPEMPRERHESEEQRQHADALADAVEGKTEMRVQQRPRRPGKEGHGRQRNQHESEKPGECTHRTQCRAFLSNPGPKANCG